MRYLAAGRCASAFAASWKQDTPCSYFRTDRLAYPRLLVASGWTRFTLRWRRAAAYAPSACWEPLAPSSNEEAGNWQLETGNWRLETRNSAMERLKCVGPSPSSLK